MRKSIRVLITLALCLLTAASALAEPAFIPQMADWDLTGVPFQMTLGAQVTVHMPFDDDRTAQLDALLHHMTLKQQCQTLGDETWNRLSVLVDGGETMSLLTRETPSGAQVQTSFLPDKTFMQAQGGQNALLNALMGEGAADVSLFGIDGSDASWLDDALQLLNRVGEVLGEYKAEEAIKTTIKDMGVARVKQSYVIPKADAMRLAEAVAQACPAGSLRDVVTSLVFSGQQKLYLWRTADGDIIRAEYAGKCGVDEDHLREASLLWRLSRGEELRDDLTLKTPALHGRDRNSLRLNRVLKESKSGEMRYTGDFTYEWVADGAKTTLTGEMDLTSAAEGDASCVTGEVLVKRLLPEATQYESMRFTPDLLIGSDGAAPTINGTLLVEELSGRHVLEQAAVTVQAGLGEYFDWEMREQNIVLDQLGPEQLDALRQEVSAAMASALIPHLAILPAEDVLYLSSGLPEATWQTIVDAAHSALK